MASDHITHRASDHRAWGQIVALLTHMAPSRPTAKSCCTRLAQRAEDSGWGLLGWRLCPNCAAEGSSSHCRKPQVVMAHLPGSCHLVNPCPTKGYQAGFVLGPLVKQVTTVLSLVLLWHVQDLPVKHTSLLLIIKLLKPGWIVILSQTLCWSFSIEIIDCSSPWIFFLV